MKIVFSNEGRTEKSPAIFIDRDGVINCRRPDDYVLDFSQFVFMPGIRAALKQLAILRLPIIVISNQAAVGKGLLDPAGLIEITERMQQALREDGTMLTAAYYCTHRPDEKCICRKPKPELLRKAAADFSIDLNRSIFIGDSQTDVEAAHAAGCKPILLGAGVRNGAGPDSIGWMNGLRVAHPQEIYGVVVKCLHELEFMQA